MATKRLTWDETRELLVQHGVPIDRLPREWRMEIDLTGLNLRGAKLSGAYLKGVRLAGTNLSYADLSYADLSEAKFGFE